MRHPFSTRVAVLLGIAAAAAALQAADVVADTVPWHDAGQIVVVTTPTWNADHGTLRRFTREGRRWHVTGEAFDVTVGRAGLGWGIGLHPPQPDGPRKAEGDGRAPAGVFAIGTAFGYAETADTALDYTPMTATDWCIDVADSPLYNSIVDTREVGEAAIEGSTEPMRRDIHVDGDQRYRQGFVIEHNPRREAAAGSCIFAHLWSAPGVPTAGCTAMADAHMRALLRWIDPAKRPVFVQLTAEDYARLQAAWDLPALPDAST